MTCASNFCGFFKRERAPQKRYDIRHCLITNCQEHIDYEKLCQKLDDLGFAKAFGPLFDFRKIKSHDDHDPAIISHKGADDFANLVKMRANYGVAANWCEASQRPPIVAIIPADIKQEYHVALAHSRCAGISLVFAQRSGMDLTNASPYVASAVPINGDEVSS